MSFKITRKPGPDRFLETVRQRLKQFQAAPPIASVIKVGDAANFWHYQEFGTGQRGDPGIASGQPFDIEPVNAKVLSWTGPSGETVFRHEVVNHPGIYPQHFITRSLKAILLNAAANLTETARNTSFDPEAIRADLTNRTMPQTLVKIIQEMGSALRGVRVDGKLHGAAAASVFSANASIEQK